MPAPSLPAMVLAVAAATQVAAASDRFVPAERGFVVADLRSSFPDEELREDIVAWRRSPQDAGAALRLATGLMQRARRLHEPRHVGRAESVLASHARAPWASASLRRLYAETLQYRHDFDGATAVYDELLQANPRDPESRLRRAALRLTRGDFAGARADCARLSLSPDAFAASGLACLGLALAGSGELGRARRLLSTIDETGLAAESRAWLLAARAELADRAGDRVMAIANYRTALELTPDDDAVRAALADVLALHGETDAARLLLSRETRSLALLVRAAALGRDENRNALVRRAREWLALEAARGDAGHDREAALLALATGDPSEALACARRNFAKQREPVDVRLLARAATLARDAAARRQLRYWLDETGYEDTVTENILRLREGG